MDKKGQTLGVILIVFISVLVGVIFLQTIAQQVGTVTNTVAVANQSETLAANGSSIYIEEYKSLSGITILNASNNLSIGSGNYTITNNVVYNGALTVKVTTIKEDFESRAVRISGTGERPTYISNSGGRAVAGLIVLLFALAILAAALYPVYSGKLMEMIGK